MLLSDRRAPVVKLAETAAERAAVTELMLEVSAERGWKADSMIHQHVHDSLCIISFNILEEVVGAMMLVHGDPADFPIKKPGTPTEDEAWPRLQISEGRQCAEVALAVVEKCHRGNRHIFLAMYARLFWEAKRLGIRYIYAILDPVIFELYRRVGYPFRRLEAEDGGGSKEYWGETTFPAKLDLWEAEEYLKSQKPALWEFVSRYQY